jgi:hypothetical protein
MKRRVSTTDGPGLTRLEDIPNVGRSIAADLRLLGITSPDGLTGRDPYAMYDELCRVTEVRHDPCLLDTFIAAVKFMNGAPAQPWWRYTEERKRTLAARQSDPIKTTPLAGARPPARSKRSTSRANRVK